MKLLSSSLLLARIRGVEIRLHISLLLSLPIAYYLFKPLEFLEYVMAFAWLAGFISCILFHELGHALVARLFGVEVKSVVVWLLGGFTNLAHKAEKPAHTLFISAAGPLVNMLLMFICVMVYIVLALLPAARSLNSFLWIETVSRLSFSLALVNFILIAFNMLPIYPLDGGNVLHALMEMLFGRSNADWITLLVGMPILLCLLAFGFITHDYLLVFSCLLIGLGLSALNRSVLRGINLGVNYLFRRGAYYFMQGDIDRALQIYTQEIDREPQQANHYLARAACYFHLMQFERAKADIERALSIAPNNVLALLLRGELCLFEKDYDRAQAFFDRALQANAHWAPVYFDRGSLLVDKKEYAAALVELNKAIALMPHHALFYLVRATAHFRLGDLAAAHKDEDEALRLGEKDALVMTEYNLMLYDEFLDWAEAYYARVIAQKGGGRRGWGQAPAQLGYAYQGRADAYRFNQLHDQAVADYTTAIQLMPKEAPLYLARGKSYKALNESEKARTDFETVLTLADKSHLKRQANELLKSLQL